MKSISFGLLFLGALTFTACSGNSSNSNSDTTKQTGKEYTSAYICPMHCEGSGSEEPGQCPVCGMNYEKNEEHKHGEEGHDHSH